ncbi:little elongation complex subunit 2 isoform X2 [Amblyraja radiata]|nr:little elongation complex subunit 2 isoform X2 [Amblyraja radiata]
MYNRYSLAPTFSELCEMVSRQTVESSQTAGSPEVQQPPNTSSKPEAAAPAPGNTTREAATFPIPEPRVPYPRFSALTEREQRSYVQLMQRFKNTQWAARMQGRMYGCLAQFSELKNTVWNEVPEFMKYLQNVARMCAEDYDVTCQDAVRYTEEVLQAWNDSLKKYPELYTVNEMTSIMGGKFIPDLTLRLEKKLLCLGRATYLRVPTAASAAQLTTDYKTIASFTPASARASAFESDISGDENAERLSVKYGAKLSLTSRALFTLLNNCGPKYTEPWELPVHVKTIHGEGNKMEKVIFIDSPLPKKELSTREKNLLFYEVPLDLLMSKKSYTAMSNLTLDKAQNIDTSEEMEHQRPVNAPGSGDLDFNADFTQLETFGTISSEEVKPKDGGPRACKRTAKAKTAKPAPVAGDSKGQGVPEAKSQPAHVVKEKAQEGQLPSSRPNPNSGREPSSVEASECGPHSSSDQHKAKPMEERGGEGEKERLASCKAAGSQESDSDSDEERMVIDTSLMDINEARDPVEVDLPTVPEKPDLPSPEEIIPDTPRSPSPDRDPPSRQKTKVLACKRKAAKPLLKEFDPVGQILRMQCKLLKPIPKQQPVDQTQATQEANSTRHNPPGQPPLSHNPLTAHIPQSHHPAALGNVPTSLGKTGQSTRAHLLPEELLNCDESASDYTEPASGNVAYKLFSLSDLLLLVRGSVHKTQIRPRSNKGGRKKHVPVYVLPKLEYQPMYGIEALTESEICQLWTESLINSNSWFYIGHIDVFTSKILLIDQFPAASITEKLGSFNPVNSINILHHILRKLTSLPEDRYLLSHSSGDSSITIYRTSLGGRFTRAAYNLHATHSTLPAIPSTLSMPWVPLDPSVLLPFHIHHGRAPCTFPPRPADNPHAQKVGVAKAKREIHGPGGAVTTETKSHHFPPAQPSQKPGPAPKKRRKRRSAQNRVKKRRAMQKTQRAQGKAGQ